MSALDGIGAGDAIVGRSVELKDDYTERLDRLVNSLVPVNLDNAEYAARCAASFGHVHGVDDREMIQMVSTQFMLNFRTASLAVRGAGNA